jgi:hypothetical protein
MEDEPKDQISQEQDLSRSEREAERAAYWAEIRGHVKPKPGKDEHRPTTTQAENQSRLTRGVWIFIGLNGGLGLLSLLVQRWDLTMVVGWGATLINFAIFVALLRYRRAEAGGMLGAFVSLIVLAFIIAPIFWLAQCFVGAMYHWW